MDRLEAMSILVSVAKLGSLSAAGRALHVPLATVSRKVSELERAVGARLLVRSTRRMSLTDAGIAYLEAARRILEQVEEAEREAAGEFTAPKGELVVTAPTMFGRLHVLPVVADFLAAFPQVNIRLLLADRNVDLIDDRVDMAVRIGALPDSSLVATHIGTLRTVTCAHPGLFAARGVPRTPAGLKDFPGVAVEAPRPAPLWRYQHLKSGATFDAQIVPRLVVTTPEAAAQAAARGVGVTRVLHYQVVDAVNAGALQIVLEPYEPEVAPVHLIHASRGNMPLKMRRFLDFAAPRLRTTLNAINSTAKTPRARPRVRM